jgi:hypothetical protein
MMFRTSGLVPEALKHFMSGRKRLPPQRGLHQLWFVAVELPIR